MPFLDQRAGSCYVWVISSFLFISIVAGGIFLVLYMIQPETSATAWYPFAGVFLVCLPWFFWFLTLFYRILSRACGFRMVCWGGALEQGASLGGGGTTASPAEMDGDESSTRSSNSRESELPLKLSMAS